MANKNALIVFVKEPLSGKVKTRLSSEKISLNQSAELYKAFIKDSFSTYNSLPETDLYYFYYPENTLLQEILPNQTLWEKQSEGDLGDKMYQAFSSILEKYKKCVVVGSDHPDLPLTYLKKAFDVLDYVDISIGASYDGGYYTIGLKKAYLELFDNIEWSVDTVFSETKKRINALNLDPFYLPEWYDIDDIKDLNRFIKQNDLNQFPQTKNILIELNLV